MAISGPTLLWPFGRAGFAGSFLLFACVSCATPGGESLRLGRVRSQVFGYSREGKAITGTVLGTGSETYLLLGVVHGNEPLGEPLLRRFVATAEGDRELLDGRRLVVVPVVNPDGLERNSRVNAVGIDLNRNFPARSWRPARAHGEFPASEPETRAVMKILRQYRPSRILAIHSPLACVNFDGPAERIARRIARATSLPLRPSIGYPTPGSLGSYAGSDLQTPVITLELGRGSSLEGAWRDIYPGLRAFVEPASQRPRYAGDDARAAAVDPGG